MGQVTGKRVKPGSVDAFEGDVPHGYSPPFVEGLVCRIRGSFLSSGCGLVRGGSKDSEVGDGFRILAPAKDSTR